MPRQPVDRRVAAVKAYYWAHGNLPLAAMFLALLTGGAYHGNPHTFIPYWVNKFELRGDVHDKPPPGRPPHMDLDHAWECCYLIQAGYKLQTGEQRYFRSIRHAVSQCPRLKEILGSTHMTQQGALRSIKKMCPELARRTLRFVRLLAPATKQARAAYAAHMLSMVTVTPDGLDATQLQRYLSRFMWIDSKTVYVVPKDHLVYAPLNAEMYIEDARLPRSRSEIKKINYYVVVNAVLGPVYFKVVTGTTSIQEVDPNYPAEGYLTTNQTKAKNITIQEWKILMEDLRACVDDLLSPRRHPLNALAWLWRVGSSPAVAPPIFSFDNASAHANRDALIHLGISAARNWEPLPPHSGDLHRVIERVHARVCGAFQNWLYDDTSPRSMPAYCQKLESLFYSMEKSDIHAADIRSIHLLYQQVVTKEGGLPPVRYR